MMTGERYRFVYREAVSPKRAAIILSGKIKEITKTGAILEVIDNEELKGTLCNRNLKYILEMI